ncbi:hypothetical protein DL95DRAFT_452944 [Leptodontidium sp. 2 PMI_412]|nr:hypothetical protein DL95DRAFT_452944 [Leptodontidium sp. 2 PMI_412]
MPPSADPPVKRTIPWEPAAKGDAKEATRKEGEKECHFDRTGKFLLPFSLPPTSRSFQQKHTCGHRSAHPTLPRITHASPCTCLGVGSTLRPSKSPTTKLFHINYGCLDCDEAAQNTKLKEKMPTTSAPADDTMKFSAPPGLTITTFDEYNAKVRAEKAEKDEVARVPLAAKSHKIKSEDEDDIQMLNEESKMEADRQPRRLRVKEMIGEDQRSQALKEERQKVLAVAAVNKERAESQKTLQANFPPRNMLQDYHDSSVFKFEMDSGDTSTDEAQAESKNPFGKINSKRDRRAALFPSGPTAKDCEASIVRKRISSQHTRPALKTFEDLTIPSDFWYQQSSKTRIPKAPTDLREWQSLRSRAIKAANERGDPSEFIEYYVNKFLMESVANRAAMHTKKVEAGKAQDSTLISSASVYSAVSYGIGIPGRGVPGSSSKPVQKCRRFSKDDFATAGSEMNSPSAIARGQLFHGGLPSAASTSLNFSNETQAKTIGACIAMGQSTIFHANEKSNETTKTQHQNTKLPAARKLAPNEPSYPFPAYRTGGPAVTTRCPPNTSPQSIQVHGENEQCDTTLAKVDELVRMGDSTVLLRGTAQPTPSETTEKTVFGAPIPGGAFNASTSRGLALLQERFMIPLMTNAIRKLDNPAASARTPDQNAASAMFKATRVTEKDLNFNLLADRHPVGAPWIKGTSEIKNGNASAEKKIMKTVADDEDVKAAAIKEKCIRDAADIANFMADVQVQNAKLAKERNRLNTTAKNQAIDYAAENTKPAPTTEIKKVKAAVWSEKTNPKRLVAREVEDEWVDLAPNEAAARELARKNTSTSVVRKSEADVESAKNTDGEWEDLGGDEASWDFC